MKFKFKKFYLWFLMPVIIIVLWVFIFYLPFSAKIRQKEKELVSLKKEEQTVELNMRNALDVKNRGDQIKSSILEIQMQLPTIDVFPDFMIKVLKETKKESVVMNSFSSNFSSLEGKPGRLLVHPVFEMGLKGKFINMGKFIDELDNGKYFRGILRAKISYDEKEYPVLTGNFTMEFSARRSGVLESK
jgi:Tfp pilus assembly protein PilO